MEKMDNTVDSILGMMEGIVDSAKIFPMTHGKVLIDQEQFLDMLADLRSQLPRELEDARRIVADRSNILETAKKEAEMTTRVAEERARKLVDHDEIVKQAQMKANEIMSTAQLQSRELKKAAMEYADSMLAQVDEQLNKSLIEVRQRRQSFRSR
ncbi:MAG TPA: ATPase [Candidatus Faecivivens stercoravium]|uniref:ATPase n=1 Tax=Candidatus Faecivivens stercoravium TaxID=2840803 RepID=A0A9D1DXU9_9FIRM|nr:ATPase [Candidatus Faecivivens stercoravium]